MSIEKTYYLVVNKIEADVIGAALSKLPYDVVAPLINKLVAQCAAQNDEINPPLPAAGTPAIAEHAQPAAPAAPVKKVKAKVAQPAPTQHPAPAEPLAAIPEFLQTPVPAPGLPPLPGMPVLPQL